jgi:hypothetical protein
MRFVKVLLAGLTLAGLAGCSGASSPPAVGPAAARTTASSVPSASPQVTDGARAAATQFYALYSAGRFSAFWDLLAAATKKQVPSRVWVGVHDACRGASAGKSRIIKSVTVFGDAAIVTESVAGAAHGSGPAEDVFNYLDGRWSYSPADLSIYHHGSVAADVAAARAAGLCSAGRIF